MSEPATSLKALFTKATQLRQSLDTLQNQSKQYQSNLLSAISTYEECLAQASSLSLFSPNESADDISSSSLQYLSIDFHIGDLLPKITTTTSNHRKLLLHSAQEAYSRYFNLLEDYDLLSPKDKKLHEKFNENKSTFTLLPSHDPTARRETKIARYNQEKELKEKLQYLSSDPLAYQNDDSALRELRLAEVNLHVHQTFYALDFIAQELQMLALAPPPSATPPGSSAAEQDPRNRDARGGGGVENGGYSERLDLSLQSMIRNGKAGPILSKSGRPLQPFTLLDSRQRLQDGVFRPSHNLPTMTIDEYLEEEKRRGGIIEGGGGEQPEKEVDEDDLEAADRETMKTREWDEFKEENPRGSGNTLNRG